VNRFAALGLAAALAVAGCTVYQPPPPPIYAPPAATYPPLPLQLPDNPPAVEPAPVKPPTTELPPAKAAVDPAEVGAAAPSEESADSCSGWWRICHFLP
jgi:hypothetical protein